MSLPGKLLRIAVIGAGHWGPNLIRNFDNAPVSLVRRVVDLDRERLAQVRARFPHVELDETIFEIVHGRSGRAPAS